MSAASFGGRPWRCAAGALVAALAAIVVAPARADDAVPSVTPYRPSVSTPAALSAPGWLEVEAGVQADRGPAGARADSLPYTLKLAFSPDWGVRVSGSVWLRQEAAGGSASVRTQGWGDSSVVLKRRFAVDDAHALGVELGVTVPSGADPVSQGSGSQSLNGIYSADLGAWHTDLNLALQRFDRSDAGVGAQQLQWANAWSRAVSPAWGWVAEASGTRRDGAGSTGQWLGAASWNVSNALTLDAGLARGHGPGQPRWSFFAGLTALAARLF
jgi:hypothetical protein